MNRYGRYKDLGSLRLHCEPEIVEDIIKTLDKSGYYTADVEECGSVIILRILGCEKEKNDE